MTKDELIDVFNAEPTRLTKEELIELGQYVGLKLSMRSKESTMINKIIECMGSKQAEDFEIVVEVTEPVKAEEVKDEASLSLGIKSLDPGKEYSLSVNQRSKIKVKGASISSVPRSMKGSELMKLPNWNVLGL
jgi:hypothetical protein